MSKIEINLAGWQDYRGKESGVLIYVETSHQSSVPVRDQLNENGKGHFLEPNYETSTWGLESCCNTKMVNTAVKAKHKYLFFGTRYEGYNQAFANKYVIMGYQQIDKVCDMRSRHMMRYMAQGEGATEPECLVLEKAMATWGTMRFVALEDSFVVTDEWIKSYSMKGRATRQLRLTLQGDALKEVLDFLNSKPDLTDEYIATVNEFKEAIEEGAYEEE